MKNWYLWFLITTLPSSYHSLSKKKRNWEITCLKYSIAWVQGRIQGPHLKPPDVDRKGLGVWCLFSSCCFALMHLFHNSFFFLPLLLLSFKPRTLRYSTAARASPVQRAMVVTAGSLALLPGPAVAGDPPGGSHTSPTGTQYWPGCWRTASEATLEPSWLPVSGLWSWFCVGTGALPQRKDHSCPFHQGSYSAWATAARSVVMGWVGRARCVF